MESSNDFIVMASPTGELIYANQAAIRILEVLPESSDFKILDLLRTLEIEDEVLTTSNTKLHQTFSQTVMLTQAGTGL